MNRSIAEAGTVEIPAAGTYRIDPGQSVVSFVTRHMFGLGRVRGTFRLRDGEIDVADPVRKSTARATISATSFDTGKAGRDTTVRSAQYLDAENHPDITFASTQLDDAAGPWVLRGTLTVCGVSKQIDVQVGAADVDGPRMRLQASCLIDRYEFGITAMKGMTGRRLALQLVIVAHRAGPTSTG